MCWGQTRHAFATGPGEVRGRCAGRDARAERLGEGPAARPAVLGPLRQGAGDDRALDPGEHRQVGLAHQVAGHHVGRVAGERQAAGPEVAVGDGQAVLVGVPRGRPEEELGGRVGGGPLQAGVAGDRLLHPPRRAEVGDLHAAADEEDVLRLEVAMLDAQARAVADAGGGAR